MSTDDALNDLQSALERIKAVLPERIGQWVSELVAAHLVTKVNLFTLAAVMDRESNGASPHLHGADGHGKGLMQIDDRYHKSFCQAQFDTGALLVYDAGFNTLYGSYLLRRNLEGAGGDYPTAIAGYNCGLSRAKLTARMADAALKIKVLDQVTEGRNYVSDVLRRQAQFEKE